MSVNTDRAVALVRCGAITEKRSCLSKVSYAIRTEALGAAKRVAQKTRRATGTYACSYCHGYHVYKLPHTGDES